MFTEADSKKQDEEFAAIKDEYSKLDDMEKSLRKSAGLPNGYSGIKEADMTPEIRKALEEAKAKAKREGEARAAKSKK
ncbi:MAG: hypothetical protein K6F46_02605 [Desulfovibrio sp.]|nr:hypothetical protein [Desulfovibrio sp.]